MINVTEEEFRALVLAAIRDCKQVQKYLPTGWNGDDPSLVFKGTGLLVLSTTNEPNSPALGKARVELRLDPDYDNAEIINKDNPVEPTMSTRRYVVTVNWPAYGNHAIDFAEAFASLLTATVTLQRKLHGLVQNLTIIKVIRTVEQKAEEAKLNAALEASRKVTWASEELTHLVGSLTLGMRVKNTRMLTPSDSDKVAALRKVLNHNDPIRVNVNNKSYIVHGTVSIERVSTLTGVQPALY